MNFKKFISGVSALTIAASAFAGMAVTANAESASASTTMTYVDANAADTAYGYIAAENTATTGYHKVSGSTLAWANFGWSANRTAFIKVDASAVSGTITKATLTLDVSGSTDNKRTCGYGVASSTYTDWDNTLTYNNMNTALNSGLTFMGDQQWTSTKSSTTFETKNFDITAAFNGDTDKIVTIVVYETAAAGGYIKNPSVTVEASASTAAYNISYKYDGTTIYSDEGNAAVGATVAIQSPITVSGVKYYAVDGTDSSITVDADASNNNKEVTLRQANTYTASLLSSVDNSVVASTSVVEGESSSNIYYNKYILDGTTLYSTPALSDSNRQFAYSFSNVTTNVDNTLNYTALDGEYVFYKEAEAIEGWNNVNDTARMSGGKGGYPSAESTVTTLPAGKYVVSVGTRGNDQTTYTVKAGTKELINTNMQGYIQETSSEEFELTGDTAITVSVTNGSSTRGIDYILIKKTGDYEEPTTEDAFVFTKPLTELMNLNMYVTRSSDNAVADPVAVSSLDTTTYSGTGDAQLAIIFENIPESWGTLSVVLK